MPVNSEAAGMPDRSEAAEKTGPYLVANTWGLR